MGCVSSKKAPAPEAAKPSAQLAEFAPKAFAFMRLTHEVLRFHLANLEVLAKAETYDAAAAKTELAAFGRILTLHMRHEEECFFNLLDAKFEDIATKEGLREEHSADHAKLAAINAAVDTKAAFAAALAPYVEFELAHLVHEERILMPRTQMIAGTPAARGAEVQKIVMVDFDEFVSFGCEHIVGMLAKHGKYGQVRMYATALQMSTSPEQFAACSPAIKAGVPEAMWTKLESHGIGGPGKQPSLSTEAEPSIAAAAGEGVAAASEIKEEILGAKEEATEAAAGAVDAVVDAAAEIVAKVADSAKAAAKEVDEGAEIAASGAMEAAKASDVVVEAPSLAAEAAPAATAAPDAIVADAISES